MEITGALVREQALTFAVVLVKSTVMNSGTEADKLIARLGAIFRAPVVLMAQKSSGQPVYYGRRDIARFMSNVPISAIRWKKYTIN